MSTPNLKSQMETNFPGMEVRFRRSRLSDGQVVYRACSPSGHLEVEASVGGRRNYVQGLLDLRGSRITVSASPDDLLDLREVLLSFWGDLGIALGMIDDVLGRNPDRPAQLVREDLHGSLVGVPPLAPLAEDVGGVVASHDGNVSPSDRDPKV